MNKRFKRYQKLLAVSLAAMSCAEMHTSGSELLNFFSSFSCGKKSFDKTNEYKKYIEEKKREIEEKKNSLTYEYRKAHPDYSVLLVDFKREVGLHRTMDKWYEILDELVKDCDIPYYQGLAWLCTIYFGENVDPKNIENKDIKQFALILDSLFEQKEEATTVLKNWAEGKSTKELLNVLYKLTDYPSENDKMCDDTLGTINNLILNAEGHGREPLVSWLSIVWYMVCTRIPCLRTTIHSVFSTFMMDPNPDGRAKKLANAIVNKLDAIAATEDVSTNPYYNFLIDL